METDTHCIGEKSAEFRPGKAGCVFKGEKLYLFDGGSVCVLSRPWPTPLAWTKTCSNPAWLHVRPDISIHGGDLGASIQRMETPAEKNGQLVMPWFFSPLDRNARLKTLAWLRWSEAVPRAIRDLIAPFPERHWHLLSFLARCGPAALDLAVANPALAYALASNWVFHRPGVQRPLRAARTLLQKKQREILGWLGFAESEAARNILRKVIPKACCVATLLYLRQSLRDSSVTKALSHLPRLNAGAIRIATDPAIHPLVAPKLLDEIAHSRAEDGQTPAAYALRDSHSMFQSLFPAKTFPLVQRLADLRDLHDSLVHDLNRVGLKELGLLFPPPPFNSSSSGDISPITSSRELLEEGRLQHNCVAAYAKEVVTGHLYIYRFRSPEERCTLSIMRRRSRWILGELKATANKPASEETWRTARAWLKEASGEADIKNEMIDPVMPF
ncbi:MAG: PcfJ domain-containing protein [Verrucomicrobia bacterium]|nr:PcfJ domain-containing protein [Verrucomicrobiota bacterium]